MLGDLDQVICNLSKQMLQKKKKLMCKWIIWGILFKMQIQIPKVWIET